MREKLFQNETWVKVWLFYNVSSSDAVYRNSVYDYGGINCLLRHRGKAACADVCVYEAV